MLQYRHNIHVHCLEISNLFVLALKQEIKSRYRLAFLPYSNACTNKFHICGQMMYIVYIQCIGSSIQLRDIVVATFIVNLSPILRGTGAFYQNSAFYIRQC